MVDRCSLPRGIISAGRGLDGFVGPVCVTESTLMEGTWLLNSGRGEGWRLRLGKMLCEAAG